MAETPSQPPATSQASAESNSASISDPPVSIATEPDTKSSEPDTKASEPDIKSSESDIKSSESDIKASEPVVAEQKPKASAPDPDEDDLDDLDDVLDDFAATKIDAQPVPSSSGPGRPAGAAAATATATAASAGTLATDQDILGGAAGGEDAFAQELQKGMADLLGELESSPEMQKQFEDMIRELSKGTAAGGGEDAAGMPDIPGLAGLPGFGTERATPPSVGASASAGASDAGKGDASFQDTIRKTMERMKESGDAAGAAAATSATSEDDFMAALLKEMENGESEEDFSKMLLGMMEQLTHKEILYEPMKELDTKYPNWMAKNADKTSAADLKRYKEQQRLVKEIVAKFEESNYSDENVKSREYILERMQKMQAEGSPPQELVGDMDVATEALGDLDAGCPTQ